jgi:alkanesulfonate monooxygenase SsuD/methylene tetrahydromethanopterin reductase-like flavin-dependent oxidoreductase (luciferase family)
VAEARLFDSMLSTMRRVWDGHLIGASGPLPAEPPGRPRLLFGGMAAASFRRVAAMGDGWVAPLISLDAVAPGIAAAREAWRTAGREGDCRVVTGRYFCLGQAADVIADHYVDHYYGRQFFAEVRQDTLTTSDHLRAELLRLRTAGCDDVVLYPCSHDAGQVDLLAAALDDIGITTHPSRGRVLDSG